MDENNTNPNPEQEQPNNPNENGDGGASVVHTEREIELERQLAAAQQENRTLREENTRMYRRYSGSEGGDGQPKESLDDWLLKMANNGGRVPADYPGGLAEGNFEEVNA